MNIPTGNLLNTFPGNYASTSVFVTIFQPRDPTTADVNYPVSKRWINTLSGNEFILEDFIVSVTTVEADWLNISNPAGTLFGVNVDSATSPGANPVLPTTAGYITATGGQLPANSTANAISVQSLAANTVNILIQRSSTASASTVSLNGISHFDSAIFSVDSSGFVSLASGFAPIQSFTVHSGTSPVVPNISGVIDLPAGNGFAFTGGMNAMTGNMVSPFSSAFVFSASVSSPDHIVTGSSTGAISILGQANAGTFNFNLPITAGTSGYFLTSAGGGSSPMTWTSISASGAVTTLEADDTTTATPSSGVVTVSGGSTGLTTTASSHTLSLTGTLVLASGGTSASLTASNGGIFYSTASAGAILPGTATARQMLQSGASTTPAWSTATWPATTSINTILYSSSASVIGQITAADNGVLISGTTGIPSWLANGTAGYVLTAQSGAPAAWAAIPAAGVTSLSGTANQITASASTGAVTLSLPATIVTPGTLAINGLTTGSVLFSAASSVVSQDNANFFWDATNHRLGLTDTAPGTKLSVVGNAQIGYTTGTTAPSSGLAVSGQTRIGTATLQTDASLALGANMYISQGQIYSFRNDGANGNTYWMGLPSGSQNTCINVAADTGTLRAVAITTSSDGTIGGTITQGLTFTPLRGSVLYGILGASIQAWDGNASALADILAFYTNSTERMRLLAGGNFCIGQITAAASGTLLTVNSAIATAPVSSATATGAFITTMTAGSSYQNTTGYDVLINISVVVTAATTATIALGVGSATSPTQNTVVTTFSVAAAAAYNFSAYVPNNYYVEYSTTGTITVGSVTVQCMGV